MVCTVANYVQNNLFQKKWISLKSSVDRYMNKYMYILLVESSGNVGTYDSFESH